MAIFNSYVSLPEGTSQFKKKDVRGLSSNIQQLLEDHPNSRSQGAPSCKFVAFCSPILL